MDTIEYVKWLALSHAKIEKASVEEGDAVLKAIAESLGFPQVHSVTLTATHIRTLVRASFYAGANYQARWEEENRQ